MSKKLMVHLCLNLNLLFKKELIRFRASSLWSLLELSDWSFSSIYLLIWSSQVSLLFVCLFTNVYWNLSIFIYSIRQKIDLLSQSLPCFAVGQLILPSTVESQQPSTEITLARVEYFGVGDHHHFASPFSGVSSLWKSMLFQYFQFSGEIC